MVLLENGAREVMGLPAAGTTPGDAAEFVAVRAANLGQAIAEAPAERIVIHNGLPIATTRVTQSLALPTGEMHG